MKLASRAADGPDGRLLIVSRDLTRAAEAKVATTMQEALDHWSEVEPQLRTQAADLEADVLRTQAADLEADASAAPLDPLTLAAPMPRAFQFLDGSAFLAHNHILADAWGYARRTEADPPLMYQGLSDRFYPAHGDVPFRSEADDIDLEAEFGVILDRTPLGVSPTEALEHVKLLVIVNDWSLRAFGPGEMRGGFGFLQAKPPSSLSMVAVTPDEIGDAWRDGRLHLNLRVHRGDALFGEPHGGAMTYDFGTLIAHAALTRDLCAGTVIGSGTVANFDAETVGSGCIAERKALDALHPDRPPTPYLTFGERVRLEAFDAAGRSVFGRLDQRIAARALSG